MKKTLTFTALAIMLVISSQGQLKTPPGYRSYKEKEDFGSYMYHVTNGKVKITYLSIGRNNPFDVGSDSALAVDIETTFGNKKYVHKDNVYYGVDTVFNKDHYCFYLYSLNGEVEIIVTSKNKDAEFKKACDWCVENYSKSK